MNIRHLLPALALTAALLRGQPNLNTVTVTASRGAGGQADEAVFSVSVIAGADQSFDDIVKALAGTSITAANLTGVQTAVPFNPQIRTFPPPAGLTWTFQWTVPLNKAKDATQTLAALQKSIGQGKSGLSLSFALANSQVSAQQRQNCDLAALIADARSKAQDIAGGAGFGTGTVVGASGSVENSAPGCSLTVTFGLRGQSAQLGPNALTVTATRTLNQAPDQALILLNVSSGPASGLDDINSALSAAGVAGATFVGVSEPFPNSIGPVNPPPPPPAVLLWTFLLPSPLAKLKDTFAQLGIAQKNIATRNPGVLLSFSVSGLSPLAPPSCPEAGLIADAKAYAQKLAVAAGLSLGGILSMSELPQGPLGFAVLTPVTTRVFGSGDFIGGIFGSVAVPTAQVLSIPGSQCGLSVQFQLI